MAWFFEKAKSFAQEATEKISQQASNLTQQVKAEQHDQREATINLKKAIDSKRENVRDIAEKTNKNLSGLKEQLDNEYKELAQKVQETTDNKYTDIIKEQIGNFHDKLKELKNQLPTIQKKEIEKQQHEKKTGKPGTSRPQKILTKYGLGSLWSSISDFFGNIGGIRQDGVEGFEKAKKEKPGLAWWLSWIWWFFSASRESLKRSYNMSTNEKNIQRQKEAVSIKEDGETKGIILPEYVQKQIKQAITDIENTWDKDEEARETRNLMLDKGHVTSYDFSQEIEYHKDQDICKIAWLDIAYPLTKEWMQECVRTANFVNKLQHDHQKSIITWLTDDRLSDDKTDIAHDQYLIKNLIKTSWDDKYLYFDDGNLLSSWARFSPKKAVYDLTTNLSTQKIKEHGISLALSLAKRWAHIIDGVSSAVWMDLGLAHKTDITILTSESLEKNFPLLNGHISTFVRFANQKIGNTSVSFS